jgi:putative phosphoesterase
MSTKIGLISDTHASTGPLQEALSIFLREKVDTIICAGDIAGYGEDELVQTIDLLLANDCLMVAGNHDYLSEDIDYAGDEDKLRDFFAGLPCKLELEVEGRRIYVVHAHPPDSLHGGIKLLDPQGYVYPDRKAYWSRELEHLDCDILIVGHTHQVFAENIGDVLVINPGSTLFNHTCMILDLPELKLHTYALSGKTPVKTWNWGIFTREN